MVGSRLSLARSARRRRRRTESNAVKRMAWTVVPHDATRNGREARRAFRGDRLPADCTTDSLVGTGWRISWGSVGAGTIASAISAKGISARRLEPTPSL